MRLTCLIIAVLLSAGCHTQGPFVEEEQFSQLRTEVSSAEELFETLGPPSVTIPRADGNQIWVYEGVYTQANATRYIPVVDLIAGSNSQTCTRLTVVVNKDNGSLSEWEYTSEKDNDYWAKTDNTCSKKGKTGSDASAE